MIDAIEKGSVKKTIDGRSEDVSCVIRYVGRDYLEPILRLQELIRQHLPSPDIFRIDTEEYLAAQFMRPESVIAAVCKGEVIAYSIASFPKTNGDWFGADFEASQTDLKLCAHLETTAVHPCFRGNGLQRKLNGHHLSFLKDSGILYVCCTTSPKNFYSMRNLFSHGFMIKALKPKFGGLMRYILHKDFRVIERSWRDVVSISIEDIQKQQELLTEGYCGIAAAKNGSGVCVDYGLPVLGRTTSEGTR